MLLIFCADDVAQEEDSQDMLMDGTSMMKRAPICVLLQAWQ